MLFSRFFRRHRNVVLRILMFASPIIPLIIVMAPDMPRFRIWDHIQSWVVHPVTEVSSLATRGASSLVNQYIYLVGTAEENKELKMQVENLEAQLLSLQETQQENERLREMLNFSEERNYEFVSAKVIGEDPSGEALGFLINIGRNQGVLERMPVLSRKGVIGTVRRVYPNSALFVAVQDPTHIADGVILRSRARFVVQGGGRDLTGSLKYLDRAADVRVGDLVITSGLDRIFPKGVPIGYVIDVERPRVGVLQEAKLRPAVDLSYLEEVMVVLKDDEILEGRAR